jgi:hypothetical protein
LEICEKDLQSWFYQSDPFRNHNSTLEYSKLKIRIPDDAEWQNKQFFYIITGCFCVSIKFISNISIFAVSDVVKFSVWPRAPPMTMLYMPPNIFLGSYYLYNFSKHRMCFKLLPATDISSQQWSLWTWLDLQPFKRSYVLSHRRDGIIWILEISLFLLVQNKRLNLALEIVHSTVSPYCTIPWPL